MWGMWLNEKTNSAKHVDCDYYNNTCDDIWCGDTVSAC